MAGIDLLEGFNPSAPAAKALPKPETGMDLLSGFDPENPTKGYTAPNQFQEPTGWSRVGQDAKQLGLGALNTVVEAPKMLVPGIGHATSYLHHKLLSGINADPTQHEPQNLEQKISRGVGEAVPGAFAPSAAAPSLLRTAGNIAVQGLAGASGAVAEEMAPEGIKPVAKFMGNIIGGYVGGKPLTAIENAVRARTIPTVPQIRSAGNQAYDTARAIGPAGSPGVQYQMPRVATLQSDITRQLLRNGHRPDTSGKTFSRIDELMNPQGNGINPNFSDIEGVRQALNVVRREEVHPLTGRPTADGRAASVAIDRIDNFLADPGNAIPAHQGMAATVADSAQEGRGNWRSAVVARGLENSLAKGERNAATSGSGTNIDNALRQQIKQILNNPQRAAGFNREERAMMEEISRGNPVRNSARLLGKLASTGIVSTAGVQLLAHSMGLGPFGRFILPTSGWAAKKAGDIMTARGINRLIEGVRTESPLGRSRNIQPRASTWPHVGRAGAAAMLNEDDTNPYAP